MSAKTNPVRGEVKLTLGGKDYRLVPSYGNLVSFEEASGTTLLEVAARLNQRTIKIADVAALIATAAEPALSKDEAGRLLAEEGLVKAIGPVASFLGQALTGLKEGRGWVQVLVGKQ